MLVHMVSTADPLSIDASDLWIRRVGEPTRRSPMVRLLHGRASSPHYVHESDRVLLDGLSRFDAVDVRWSSRVTGFTQDSEGVSLSVATLDGLATVAEGAPVS